MSVITEATETDTVVNIAQNNWRYCNKCQGLFFALNSTSGTCPAGGGHNYSGSGNYTLDDGIGNAVLQ